MDRTSVKTNRAKDEPEKLTPAEARRHLLAEAERICNSIQPKSLASLRDRAIIGLIGYTQASLEATVGIRLSDYYLLGGCRWVRLFEGDVEKNLLIKKGSRVERYLDEYLAAGRLQDELIGPMFRFSLPGRVKIDSRPMRYRDATKAIRKRIYDLEKPPNKNITEIDTQPSARAPDPIAIRFAALLEKIEPTSIMNLRLRAIIGLMLYTGASMRGCV